MADAFQNLKSALNRGITTINVKTSSSLEKSKIKTHIESLTRDIERDISAAGEAAYKLWADNSQDYSSLESYFETIKSKYDEIARLSEQLNSIDDRDNQILGNTAPETREVIAPKFVCTNCGAQYENPVKFCRKCGNKMAE
ncbi:MAG: zinc-ribbon domain-containing protein [Oscillospiraceae bacterium]|nr:zinc-ribbon domain-containing protein [Oscillospiraceae bacterium]